MKQFEYLIIAPITSDSIIILRYGDDEDISHSTHAIRINGFKTFDDLHFAIASFLKYASGQKPILYINTHIAPNSNTDTDHIDRLCELDYDKITDKWSIDLYSQPLDACFDSLTYREAMNIQDEMECALDVYNTYKEGGSK